MQLATLFTDDQIAIFGCTIVFGGCLILMMISQKFGDHIRNTRSKPAPDVLHFRNQPQTISKDRKAA